VSGWGHTGIDSTKFYHILIEQDSKIMEVVAVEAKLNVHKSFAASIFIFFSNFIRVVVRNLQEFSVKAAA